MSIHAMKRLLREWAALLAVFAMALGPLALATSRGLGAAEKVAVTAGMKPLALCLPGGFDADPAQSPLGGSCDHCTIVQPFVPVGVSAHWPALSSRSVQIAGIAASHDHSFPRAPPARGPPIT